MPRDTSKSETIQAGDGYPRFRIPAEMVAKLSRPNSIRGRLQRACFAVYLEHEADGALPTGGRFIWYELEQRGVVDKTEARGHGGKTSGIDQDVSKALLWLREKGLIPWGAIRDGTRYTSNWRGSTDVSTGVLNGLDSFTIDPWQGRPPFILSESRQTAEILGPLAREYRILLSGLGGQVHGHLVTDVAPHLVEGQRLLYLGDLDLVGNQIEQNVISVLEGHNRVNGVTFERLMLTPAQVEKAGLEPIYKKDDRYNDSKLHPAVELEAFGQRQIIATVRERLEAILPESLEDVRVREDEQRAHVRELLEREAS